MPPILVREYMADLSTGQPDVKKRLDGGNFGFEVTEGIAEAGIIGTLMDVVLVSLSSLPVHVVTAAQSPYVAGAVAGVIAIVQTARAFRRNYN